MVSCPYKPHLRGKDGVPHTRTGKDKVSAGINRSVQSTRIKQVSTSSIYNTTWEDLGTQTWEDLGTQTWEDLTIATEGSETIKPPTVSGIKRTSPSLGIN
jgi:hypothetical protein